VLDRLTGAGFRERYPEEADRRDYLGKFWFRPMGGESWADVALRVRSALLDIRIDLPDERVLIVSHDVPILLCRYVLERLSEAEVTALSGQVHNCSVTRYERLDQALELAEFSDTSALERDAAAPVTAHD
jgi:broad specificity phosphatase PhoE